MYGVYGAWCVCVFVVSEVCVCTCECVYARVGKKNIYTFTMDTIQCNRLVCTNLVFIHLYVNFEKLLVFNSV